MTYKEITLNLPHSLNIIVSCCKNKKCNDPNCSNDSTAAEFQSNDSRRHCIKIENYALYPIIFSADNKMKCGVLKFSDNGGGRIISDDHNWQYTKYIKNGKKA